MPQHRRTTLTPLFPLLLLTLIGCTTPPPVTPQLLGQPPAPSEDPFFDATVFEDLEPAPTSGTLGDPYTPPHQVSLPLNQPQSYDTTPHTRTIHCFSCVEICRSPQGQSPPQCTLGKEELCGWGSSQDPSSAQKMAVAQCQATLQQLTPKNLDIDNYKGCSLPYCE